jgi:hypothetical protein
VECPKCAAVQADDRIECSSCGVVFARYRDAQERAFLTRRTLPQNAEVSAERDTIVPRSLVIVAVVLVLAFGVIWTAGRRTARAKFDADAAASAMLDDINQKGVKSRQRLQAEADRARAMRNSAQVSTPAAPAMRPIGLSEELAAQIMNQCSGFNTEEQVLLPKAYSDYSRHNIDETYPAFAVARNDKIVEVHTEPGIYKVTVPDTAHFRMTIKEDENHYIVPLGRRRITAIRELTGTADNATARFEFGFEQRVAGEILVRPYTDFHGQARFLKKDGAWRVLQAWTFTPDGRETDQSNLCS